MQDPVSSDQQLSKDLHRVVYYLCKRYPDRIRVHWINPWSLPGLWVSFKFRLKGFPCVVINRQEILGGDQLGRLEQRVVEILGQPPPAES